MQEKLPDFLRAQRWFGGKAQPISAAEIVDVVPFAAASPPVFFLLVRVQYQEGPAETYSVPLAQTTHAAAVPRPASGEAAPHLDISGGGEMVLYDATRNQPFLGALLQSIRENRSFRGRQGELRAASSPVLEELAPSGGAALAPKLMAAEQSNSSVIYGDRLVLKIFRRLEQGINPDLEIGRFLTENTGYRHVPLLAGYLEYAGDDGSHTSLAILQSFVRNQGDAWEFTLQNVGRYFDRVLTASADKPPVLPTTSLLGLAEHSVPGQVRELVGPYLDSAQLLGTRTAELHLALASAKGDPAFDPEPYSRADQRTFCEAAVDLLRRNFRLLRRQQPCLQAGIQQQAQHVLDSEPELERRLHWLEECAITALRTRIHGDYHLGQVLVCGDDFVIIDFEGEPARPLAERRHKQSPLQDVAGMLRSFQYAAYAPLLGVGPQSSRLPLPPETLGPWAYLWQMWVSAAFLHSYFATSRYAPFHPRDTREVLAILEAHLLEKAVYELGYELNNRPSWVRIPLSGIAQLTAGWSLRR